MSTVQLREIVQSLGGHQVLDGLSLRIDAGEYVVLLGPSGCGKTTTLRIIAGLQTPDRGEVFFDDRCVNLVAPRNRDVAMVFQHDALYPHLNVESSIRFALRGKLSAEEIQTRVDEAVKLTRIESLLQRFPSQLSGGELRRAAIAKSVARRTSVRLLDEPLSALDAPVRHELQADILRWHTAFPGTTIHVTHDGQEAMRTADKIAVMDSGKIVQYGTPLEVYARPQTLSVARAVGSPPINVLSARTVSGRAEFSNPCISCGGELRLPGPDRPIQVAIRPGAFQLPGVSQLPESEKEDDDAAIPNRLVFKGEVQRMRPVERDWQLSLTMDGDSVLVNLGSDSIGLSELRSSMSLVLSVRIADVHLFDGETGRRIEAADVG